MYEYYQYLLVHLPIMYCLVYCVGSILPIVATTSRHATQKSNHLDLEVITTIPITLIEIVLGTKRPGTNFCS